MTQYNVERLKRLRRSIEREAKLGKHDQGVWGRWLGSSTEFFHWLGYTYEKVSCPTAACAAGWATVDAGAYMLFSGHGEHTAEDCLTKNGEVRNISAYAQELLGLSDDEANILFAPDHSTEGVLNMLDQIIVAALHERTWREQRRMMARTP